MIKEIKVKEIKIKEIKEIKVTGQKFVAKNRAPRVQIEYDVELYGNEKKIDIPFVSGVMADLSGKSNAELEVLNERKFVKIGADNFNEKMKGMNPRVSYTVKNTITGDGEFPIDLSFKSMEDFRPDNIVKNTEGISDLLEAREHLSALLSYIDGKPKAEDLIEKLLKNPDLLMKRSLLKV